MPEPTIATHVGDGVYVDRDTDGALLLFIDTGVGFSETIVINPEVWTALKSYMESPIVPA